MDNGISLETEEEIFSISDEWWHSYTPTVLVRAAIEMCKYGMPEDEAIQVVRDIYFAAANEYGD